MQWCIFLFLPVLVSYLFFSQIHKCFVASIFIKISCSRIIHDSCAFMQPKKKKKKRKKEQNYLSNEKEQGGRETAEKPQCAHPALHPSVQEKNGSSRMTLRRLSLWHWMFCHHS